MGVDVNELERLLRQAWKDCRDCGGTGRRDDGRICRCVPLMVIRAADDE